MTTGEVVNKFLEMFILVIETAGEETGNTSYKEISKIVEDNRETFDRIIDEDVPYDILLSMCIMTVLLDVHGPEKLNKMGVKEIRELLLDLYFRYLEKPVRAFSSRYGLPKISPESILVYVEMLENKEKDNEEF